MPNREFWLAVTSDDVWFKAENFLKLIKPPDGEEMTDLNIKLDWNKVTGDKWTVNAAKNSMLAEGYDWEKREPVPPLSEDNFRVIFTGGDPVREFELLEQWMGPALGVGDPYSLRDGVSPVRWPPGSMYDRWPVDGLGATFNTLEWINVLAAPDISDSEYWFPTLRDKINDTAANSNKVSENGHGDSIFYTWTSVQDPDLGVGEQISLFKENADGDPFPLRARMKYAV